MPWVTLIILIPAVGSLLMFLMPRKDSAAAEGAAAGFALATLAIVVVAFTRLDRDDGALQLIDHRTWIDSLGLAWDVGVDGISIWMMGLTAVLFVLAIFAAIARMPERPRAFLGLILLAEAGLMGLFAAGDLVLFYVFWEAMLVPFALLVWMWGDARRRVATLTFVIYTMVGSLLMLVAIVATGVMSATGDETFNFSIRELVGTQWSQTESTWLFAAFALAFLIKLPLFPFHGWMPLAYGSSPLIVTALLSAVMSKAGAYGLIRIGIPIFPEGAGNLALPISILAVIGIIYGSLVAWQATSMRMLVAYSSLAHLGFIILAIMAFNQMAGQGAVLQMVNHGVVTAAAFAMVGILGRVRDGDEQIDGLSGLAKNAPWAAGIFLVISMAALAIPGSNAFVGEFFMLTGIFQERPVLAVIACVGVVYASVYMLRLYQSTMNGAAGDDATSARRSELRSTDVLYIAPLVVAMLVIALWPAGIMKSTEAPVQQAYSVCEPAGNLLVEAEPGSREYKIATEGPCR